MSRATLAILFLAFLAHTASSQRVLWCYVSYDDTCTFYHEEVMENDQVIVKGNHWNTTDNSITVVFFEQSTIHFLPTDIFSVFKNVQYMYVHKQSVRELRPGTFQDAAKLESLVLSNNKIRVLGEDSFKGAKELYTLDLNDNEMEVIHENAFQGLEHLMFLNMSFNKLKALPIGVFNQNVFLASISLQNNLLNSIAIQTFEHLFKLTTLILINNVCINKVYFHVRLEFEEIDMDLINCGMPFVNEALRTTRTDALSGDLEVLNSNYLSLKEILGMVDSSLIEVTDKLEHLEYILRNETMS